MSFIEYAKRELEIAGYNLDEDGPNKWIAENVLELLEVFSKQGHSGSSAPWCVSLFKTLAAHEPISPLTGDDSEWMEVGNGLFQNIRCPRVFKQDGVAYDIDGKVFTDPDGFSYTDGESRVSVTFPYVPKTEYIKR